MKRLVTIVGTVCAVVGALGTVVNLRLMADPDRSAPFQVDLLFLFFMGIVPFIGGCVLCRHAARWSKAIDWRPSEPKVERLLRALMFLGGTACVWYGLSGWVVTLRELWAPTDQMPSWFHIVDVAVGGFFPTITGMFLCWHPLKVTGEAEASESRSRVRQKADAVLSYWFDLPSTDALKFFGGVFFIWFLVLIFYTDLADGERPLGLILSLPIPIILGVLYCRYVVRKALIPEEARSAAAVPIDTIGLPIWRWAILSLVTFGLYQIYWFHENWKRLREHLDVPLSPGWSTAGLVIPIANFICLYEQLSLVHDLGKRAGVEGNHSPVLLTFGYMLTYVTAACLIVYKWNAPGGELALSLLVPLLVNTWLLALVQKTLNSIQRKERPDLPLRASFTTGELLLLCWSPLVWLVLINAWWTAAAG